jgi:ABC-type sulfate/molybdate transport systems ATPase subunit
VKAHDDGRPALQARGLRLVRDGRGGRFELSIDALDLKPGEVLAILGPNGAGKSTLLKALAGLTRPDAGEVICIADGPVTMVFQRPIALAGTVQHNVQVALRASGGSRTDIAHRSATALAHLGIGALADRAAASLSGGELRRLALARAFALEPAVLLLDEPFDDLDAGAQETLSRDLRRIVARTSVAVGVVTHDLRRAALVCDRIAILLGGRLRQIAAKDDVLMRPADPEIAELVGMNNLLPAVMGRGGIAIVDEEHALPTHSTLPEGSPLWVGLRPEHLKVDIGRGEGEPLGKGHVVECVSDGVLTTLVVRWAGHPLRTHLVSGRGLARVIRTGDAVSLSVRTDDVHVLARRLGDVPP